MGRQVPWVWPAPTAWPRLGPRWFCRGMKDILMSPRMKLPYLGEVGTAKRPVDGQPNTPLTPRDGRMRSQAFVNTNGIGRINFLFGLVIDCHRRFDVLMGIVKMNTSLGIDRSNRPNGL